MENTQIALCDVRGLLDDLLKKLSGEDGGQWMAALKRFLRKEDPWEKPLFKYDKTKDSWTLLEDASFDGQPFVPDIVGFLEGNESRVNGEVMKQRAKKLNANLGQHHAEYLLEHQDLIPKEWRGKFYLTFPGTVWRGRGGDRFVPYLFWLGGEWCLGFDWLGLGWVSYARLVCLRW